ncbi:hypothetical protein KC640_02295, partial [Candidatus Dojkabacteria bacterium]|nr:hypothetical protein [Candidatus Dojkabacteria bacterium]
MNDDQTNPQVPETPTLSVADAPSEMLGKKPAAGQSIKVPVIIGGVLVVVAVAAGSLVLLSQNTATTDTNQPAIDQPVILSEFASFKDGTYYTEVSYYVEPLDKDEVIGVTLVIENGAIKSATAVSIEDGEEVASSYMDEFNDGVADKVVATN